MRLSFFLCVLVCSSAVSAASVAQAQPPQPRLAERTPAVRSVRGEYRALRRIALRRIERDADMDKFNDWVRRHFRTWLERRMVAMTALESAARVAASPLERTIAAAHVAAGYADFVHHLQAVRPPPSIRRDPELLAVYRSALESASEPYRQRAVVVYEACESSVASAGPSAERWNQYCRESREALQP